MKQVIYGQERDVFIIDGKEYTTRPFRSSVDQAYKVYLIDLNRFKDMKKGITCGLAGCMYYTLLKYEESKEYKEIMSIEDVLTRIRRKNEYLDQEYNQFIKELESCNDLTKSDFEGGC